MLAPRQPAMYAPATPADERRMRTAQDHAAARLAVTVVTEPVWGWHGRTIGARVTAREGIGWLRVLCTPIHKRGGRQWTGTADADAALPDIPKPRLLRAVDWDVAPYAYRGELTEFVCEPVCSAQPTLTHELVLPETWWRTLRNDLDKVAAVTTGRVSLRQDFIDWLLPTYLGPGVGTTALSWTTAHCDCHWANLTLRRPLLLDWEDWGLAPTGLDAAMLYTYALLAPATAVKVRAAFTDLLDTPSGLFAQLLVLALLLRTTADGDNLDLVPVLHARRQQLLTG